MTRFGIENKREQSRKFYTELKKYFCKELLGSSAKKKYLTLETKWFEGLKTIEIERNILREGKNVEWTSKIYKEI